MKFCDRVKKYYDSRLIYEGLHDEIPAIYLLFELCNERAVSATIEQGQEIFEDLTRGVLHEFTDYNTEEVTKYENYVRTGKMKYDMTVLAKDGEAIGNLLNKMFEPIWNLTTKDLYDIIEKKILTLIGLIKDIDSATQEADPAIFEANFLKLMNRYDWTKLEEEYQKDKKTHIVTMEWLQEKQERELQKVLELDIMHYADDPSAQAIEDSDYQYHRRFLSHKFKESPDYLAAYTKYKQFATRQEGMIIPKLGEYGKYIAIHINKFRPEQKIALFAISKKFELIHKDMVRLNPELGKYLGLSNDEGIEGTKYFGIYINLLKMFEEPWFKEFRSDKKYNLKWIEQFLNNLLRSEWRDEIADEWYKPDKKKTVLGYIIGCLITAGVLVGSDSAIASTVVNYIKFDDKVIVGKTIAINFGKGRKKGYCEWICDYVKH